jgi:glycosyltransferase involved in cell wall biosynthesis
VSPLDADTEAEGARDQVLALVPAHNEEGRVARVVADARKHLPVLVVDDGSIDGTRAAAENAGATILAHSVNQGKGAALRTGFRWALSHGYPGVLTLDADGQHDPAEIPGFLAAYRETSAALIIGARDFSHMPPVRRLSNTLGRWVFSWAIGRPIRDNQSGYRLLDRRLVEYVVESREDGFAYEVEMIAVCVGRGLGLQWVPIRTIYAGQTSHIKAWGHVRSFLQVSRRAHAIVKQGGRL